MKLYGNFGSTCTRKVLLTLAEKGEEVQFVSINLAKGEQKSSDHVQRQPFGVIPVLEDDGFSLYESRAIIRYLDAKLPNPRLTPTDLRDRARMEQWISVEHSYFSSAVMGIVVQKLFLPMRGQQPDEGIVAQGRKQVERVLDVLDRGLDGHVHLAGEDFTLADICFMPYVNYLFAAREAEVVSPRKNVASWWARVSARPSWRKIDAQH
jgi:glutathione S-transferase